MTTASTGSASLELREETPVKSRMQMLGPGRRLLRHRQGGYQQQAIRISKCYPFRCGRDAIRWYSHGPVGINNRRPKPLIPRRVT